MLSIMRSNAYIFHKSCLKKSLSHKEFTLEMINCLMNKAMGGEEHKSLSIRSSSTISSSVVTYTTKFDCPAVYKNVQRDAINFFL